MNGVWVNNKLNGVCSYIKLDGKIIKGVWINNKFEK